MYCLQKAKQVLSARVAQKNKCLKVQSLYRETQRSLPHVPSPPFTLALALVQACSHRLGGKKRKLLPIQLPEAALASQSSVRAGGKQGLGQQQGERASFRSARHPATTSWFLPLSTSAFSG